MMICLLFSQLFILCPSSTVFCFYIITLLYAFMPLLVNKIFMYVQSVQEKNIL